MSQPFLRWAGSKRKLLPHLLPFWNQGFTRYVEPFMGSACLYFALRPTAALLGDLNGELVETFRTVRDYPGDVHRAVHELPISEQGYYSVRRTAPRSLAPDQRAARFIYLNRFCFNGLYRTNKAGEFNVPYGAQRSGQLPSLQDLQAVARCLETAVLRHCDFEELLQDVKGGDLVYLDPPYAVANVRMFRQYGPQTFGRADLTRLKEAIVRIEQLGAKFVLSYAESEEVEELFSGWPIYRVATQRNISGFSKHRRRATEMLVTNTRLSGDHKGGVPV